MKGGATDSCPSCPTPKAQTAPAGGQEEEVARRIAEAVSKSQNTCNDKVQQAKKGEADACASKVLLLD